MSKATDAIDSQLKKMLAESGDRDLQSLVKTAASRSNAMDSMSARVMAASKPVIARSGFDRRGTDPWLSKRPK